jgi:hypothetical protein
MIGKIVGWRKGEAVGAMIVGSNVPNLYFYQKTISESGFFMRGFRPVGALTAKSFPMKMMTAIICF